MALKLANKVIKFLEDNIGNKYTARQIAEWIFETFPKECQEKKERSGYVNNDDELIKQIAAEVGAQYKKIIKKKSPNIEYSGERPRKYYFDSKKENIDTTEYPSDDEASIVSERFVEKHDKIDSVKHENKLIEKDLYPVLAEYLWNTHNIYPKRIDEKTSSNMRGSKGNMWLYPDMVGMECLNTGWKREIADCAKNYPVKKSRLWSFEVKNNITSSTVRQSYFQTISNSTWANFGYLVFNEIDKEETLKELRMLSSMHGIGVIELNYDNPTESTILIQARENHEIDWNMCNRLAMENSDFIEYIKLIDNFSLTGSTHEQLWDISKNNDL